MAKSVLIVDDEQSIIQSLEGILRDEGFDVESAYNGPEALEKIERDVPDLVLLDIWMPEMDGLDALVKIKEAYPHLQVVMMSGHGTIETAVKATKLGAYDFIEKPLSLEKVLLTINNALERYRLEEEISLLKERDRDKYRITGNSEAVGHLKEQIRIVAPTNAWVLISGENGTGKELVAHTIHRMSKRGHKPMVEVNCAAIPEELIESELFGHEKGAFTGAIQSRKGRFEIANGGTIFLDEIGDLSPTTQIKLLRVLQEREFERVGGNETIRVNVRVITATNRNLEEQMASNEFREDLYYRLNVFPIPLPPLRDRKSDILLLADHFIEKYANENHVAVRRISTPAIDLLMSYHWPGNVRELENCIERAVLLSVDEVIHSHHLPPSLQSAESTNTEFHGTLEESLDNLEREILLDALKSTRGNMAKAARLLGITERIMGLRVKKHDIDARQFRTRM